MSKVSRRLEQKAYASIAAEMEAERELEKFKHGLRGGGNKRRSFDTRLGQARRRCLLTLELHDAFARAAEEAREALEIIDLDTGRLRDADEMEHKLLAAAQAMQGLADVHCARVGKYIRNRAPGLALYAVEFRTALAQLATAYGDEPVRLACIILRLDLELRGRGRMGSRFERRQHLLGACALLRQLAGDRAIETLEAVRQAHEARHRASSAIEGFNAALRPHLYVHKGASQGFLELFRAYLNMRTRRWGRHKGTSALECLTGKPVHDWLTHLGYPRSEALH